ncbi:hypothetical protein WJX73_000615 [Symbiochloris irregularis]|uniref:RAP domain-containing protein n=1 Tax=Symbiochloris irregularis TaxID=706552 RepID=A0AAW1P0K6_9CHLO
MKDELSREPLSQLHMAKCAWDASASEAPADAALPWPEALMTSAAQACSERCTAAAVARASITRQVSESLSSMGISHTLSNQQSMGSPELVVDITFPDQDHLALLVHGPQDFAQNDIQVPLGPAVLQQKILRQQGWAVASVPWYEWYRISHSLELRQQYLHHLLR